MNAMSEVGPSNREVLSVSELTRSARQLLEGEFPMVFVEGEISNFMRPSSGHWYLTLKDDKSQLRCAMFAGRNRLIRFTPRDGMQVLVRGRISLYEARGEFQMIAEFMEEAGDGALRRAFDKLKASLDAEGLFAASAKQPIPAIPRHLGVITSPTGAAIRDVLHVLARRFPAIHVSVIPVQVQGDESVRQIVAALDFANRYQDDRFDVLLLTRGGGSLEDLWSFNTEQVARAIFASKIPVVCAVGHETDFTIADFVADLRAPTPSAAAEMVSPDGNEWLAAFNRVERTLTGAINSRLGERQRHIEHVSRRLRHPGTRLTDLHQRIDELDLRMGAAFRRYLSGFRFEETRSRLVHAINRRMERVTARLELTRSRLSSPAASVAAARTRVDHLGQRLVSQMRADVRHTAQRLGGLAERLETVNPEAVLSRGYAIVTHAGRIVSDASDVEPGAEISARLHTGQLIATVTKTEDES
ncbi:MAG TPA: exodeoxyribonuclease VII large subunit [Pseudomonadales bacterium]|nr:exodeoxyribonuclease VII large subunit [Pseudomonadales bacterium]